MLARLRARPRARHRAGRDHRRRHHGVAVSVRRCERPAPSRGGPRSHAPELIDPDAHDGALRPCWPGNGSTWRGLRRRPAAAAVRARARGSDRGVARRHRLHDAGRRIIGASLGGLVGVAFAVRHPDRVRAARHDLRRACAPTAGARRRVTSSASSCATACAPAMSRPAWRAHASSAC